MNYPNLWVKLGPESREGCNRLFYGRSQGVHFFSSFFHKAPRPVEGKYSFGYGLRKAANSRSPVWKHTVPTPLLTWDLSEGWCHVTTPLSSPLNILGRGLCYCVFLWMLRTDSIFPFLSNFIPKYGPTSVSTPHLLTTL